MVVVGSGYVRDGAILWHCKGRNAVKYQHSWVLDGASSPAHYLGFSAATCLEHANVCITDIGSSHRPG